MVIEKSLRRKKTICGTEVVQLRLWPGFVRVYTSFGRNPEVNNEHLYKPPQWPPILPYFLSWEGMHPSSPSLVDCEVEVYSSRWTVFHPLEHKRRKTSIPVRVTTPRFERTSWVWVLAGISRGRLNHRGQGDRCRNEKITFPRSANIHSSSRVSCFHPTLRHSAEGGVHKTRSVRLARSFSTAVFVFWLWADCIRT